MEQLTFPIQAKTTYLYYDGPQVFSAVDKKEQLYLVMAVSENDLGQGIFLAAPVSDIEIKELEAGAVDMRTAFLDKTVYRFIMAQNTELEIQHIVPDAWLPEVGVKLVDPAAIQ